MKELKQQKIVKSPKKKKKEEKVNWKEMMGQDKRVLHRGKGGAWK